MRDGLQENDALYSIKEEEEIEKMSRGGRRESSKLEKRIRRTRACTAGSPLIEIRMRQQRMNISVFKSA